MSPYNSMGNNPISNVDPEGALFINPLTLAGLGKAIGTLKALTAAVTITATATTGLSLSSGLLGSSAVIGSGFVANSLFAGGSISNTAGTWVNVDADKWQTKGDVGADKEEMLPVMEVRATSLVRGTRLSYNPNFLQYSEFADDVSGIAFWAISPILIESALAIGFADDVYRGYRLVKKPLDKARHLGKVGERLVGDIGDKVRIPSLTKTANYRIPDGLTRTTLSEVKNVKHLNYSSQLKDFHIYARKTGRQFILHTRSNTTFSTPLRKLIQEGKIIHKIIPGL